MRLGPKVDLLETLISVKVTITSAIFSVKITLSLFHAATLSALRLDAARISAREGLPRLPLILSENQTPRKEKKEKKKNFCLSATCCQSKKSRSVLARDSWNHGWFQRNVTAETQPGRPATHWLVHRLVIG